MDVVDIREKKKEVTEKINSLLFEFSNETGVIVDKIKISDKYISKEIGSSGERAVKYWVYLDIRI